MLKSTPMVWRLIELLPWFLVVLVLAANEFLDTHGRLEVIQNKYPWVWRLVNARPFRLVILLLCFAFLGKDFRDAVSTAPPPIVKYAVPPVPQVIAVQEDEPADSLRRRAKLLADEVDAFWEERNANHPPRSNGQQDATGEQAIINQRSNAYDRESDAMCTSRFGERMVGIPREMRLKGLDVKWLDRLDPQRCLYQQDVEILRNLAFHLDAKDRVVQF